MEIILITKSKTLGFLGFFELSDTCEKTNQPCDVLHSLKFYGRMNSIIAT